MSRNILFMANNNLGEGLSGGDRIFSELIRHWSAVDRITLMGSEEALALCASRGVRCAATILTDRRNHARHLHSLPSLSRHVLRRTRKGLAAVRRNAAAMQAQDCVYSVSDFYPDFLPALRLKRRCPGCLWMAGYYLFVASPWASDNPYRGVERVRGLAYWLLQRGSYPLIHRHADFVLVTSEPDVARFVGRHRPAERVIVVRGGVDCTDADRAFRAADGCPVAHRPYTACFIGRLHYQKGVRELMHIWRRVLEQRPAARLALIGDGPLDHEIRATARRLRIAGQVDFFGFLDGPEKFRVFQQSRMVLHPATYDSGGMAAAEAMAWGLPGVAFDLEALRTYYPRGMVKIPPGDLDAFAAEIVRLAVPSERYFRLAAEARDLIRQQWDWRVRAGDIHRAVFGDSA